MRNLLLVLSCLMAAPLTALADATPAPAQVTIGNQFCASIPNAEGNSTSLKIYVRTPDVHSVVITEDELNGLQRRGPIEKLSFAAFEFDCSFTSQCAFDEKSQVLSLDTHTRNGEGYHSTASFDAGSRTLSVTYKKNGLFESTTRLDFVCRDLR